ncbi:MAG: UDP-N-acetylmuramoyl-L-alanine--D-glutamate ligase, partial [Clostridia bacterium]|nr:UDP-N-acetylmuramoyl-L-alanine--D-glutamate ligase [Clostridia bacterium]
RLTQLGALVETCDDGDFYLYKDKIHDLIVVSPSISLNHEIFKFARERNVEIIGEIELGYRLTNRPIIAITGTNGKTTVTDMITTVLSSEFSCCACGNIGKSFAEQTQYDYDYFVVEVSSFQLETVTNFAPKIAILTNIAPDHIDRHGSYAEYLAQKRKICSRLKRNDYLIVSADDIAIEDLKGLTHGGKTIMVSTKQRVNGVYVLGDKIFWYDEFVCNTERISVSFNHNIKNALFAISCAKILGVDNVKIKQALGKIKLHKHRLSEVDSINGVTFFNDSKATNISATLVAMESMYQPFCLILGGSYKGYGFEDLFKIKNPQLKLVVATGQTATLIEKACNEYGVKVMRCVDLRQAVISAYNSGIKCVLFSPACASFDRYSSYAERGEDFIRIVKDLRNETR